MEKGVVRFLNVDELEAVNVVIWSQPEPQLESASQRSAEPVSRMTSKAVAGVPTAIEP